MLTDLQNDYFFMDSTHLIIGKTTDKLKLSSLNLELSHLFQF